MIQKRLFKISSAVLCLFFLSGLMGITSLADSSKRDGLGNSPSNLSPACSLEYTSVLPGWVVYDDQSVYFAHNGCIYQTPLSGGSSAELWDSGSQEQRLGGLNLYDGFLYFTDGFQIRRLNLENGSDEILAGSSFGSGYYENLFLSDGVLYYVEQIKGELWRMDPDGSGQSLIARLNDASMLDGDSRLDVQFQNQYAFSDGYLYYCTSDADTAESAAMVRIPLSGGAETVTAPARSDPPGGNYTSDRVTSVCEPFAPVPAGDWIYYIEDFETRHTSSDGGKWRMLSPIGGIWRMRPDGSEKELLYQNMTPDVQFPGDLFFGPLDNTRGILAYTVRDNTVFLVRNGTEDDGSPQVIPDAIYKLENGTMVPLYSAPVSSEQTDSLIESIASVPGWIYFVQCNLSWTDNSDYTRSYAPDVTQVYRMRLDGSGLECLTP